MAGTDISIKRDGVKLVLLA